MLNTRQWTTAPALVGTDLQHRWRVYLSGTDRDGQPLALSFDSSLSADESNYQASLVGVTIDLDGSRTPSARATVTVADVPQSMVDRLDARRNVQLQLDAGYYGDYQVGGPVGPDMHTVATLKLSKITRDETGRAVLTADSFEQVILDNAELDPPLDVTNVGAASLINQLGTAAGYAIDVSWAATNSTATATLRAQDAWDGIQEVCNAQGWRVVPDSSSGLSVALMPTGISEPVAELRTGQRGTVVRRAVEQSRENYANRVRVIYEWTDANKVAQRIVGTWSDPTYAVAGNTRTATIKRATSTTQARATAAAAAIGARMLRRGRVYRVTAVAHYWIRPGDVVTITAPDTGTPERATVETITFSSNGTMDLTTRSTT